MASPLLKKTRQTTPSEQLTHLGVENSYQSEPYTGRGYTGREKLGSNKTFTEWLLSPSLYPSDERILSHKLIARRSAEFKGCFYSLETSRATYTFFCPSDAALRLSWPRLKALWSDFAMRYPGRVLGVRFLRTVGDLPIWLDDDAVKLRVNTPVRHRGEIACLVERRIVSRISIEQLSERGFYGDEVAALAQLVALQQPVKLNYQFCSGAQPVVSNVQSELLPYELLLKEVSRGIKFEESKITCQDLELLTYEGGTLAWGIKSESTREEILCALRQSFGASFIEGLIASPSSSSISNLGLALSAYCGEDSLDEAVKLRRAVRDLIVGPKISKIAVVNIGSNTGLSHELGRIFETQVVYEYKDVAKLEFSKTYGAVAVVHLTQIDLAPSVVQSLKTQGIKVITVDQGEDAKAGLLDISSRQSLADQAIEVLRGLSNTILNY